MFEVDMKERTLDLQLKTLHEMLEELGDKPCICLEFEP